MIKDHPSKAIITGLLTMKPIMNPRITPEVHEKNLNIVFSYFSYQGLLLNHSIAGIINLTVIRVLPEIAATVINIKIVLYKNIAIKKNRSIVSPIEITNVGFICYSIRCKEIYLY